MPDARGLPTQGSRPRRAPPAGEPTLTEAEVIAAATRMQLADGAGAGVRLLPCLLDPGLTLEVLARLLAAEPALAIRVLRVANAPYYGQAGQVSTLPRATQLLGLDTVRGVAAAACFDGMSATAWRRPGPDLIAFKRHSLATGMAAQALARRVAPDLADQAFMAGLLHDLGLLLLWRLRPATMAALVDRGGIAHRNPDSDSDPDLAADPGFHHADCGRLLMQTWALPTALTAAIAGHERADDEPPEAAGSDLEVLLRAGHAMASGIGFGLADEPAAPERRPPAGWEDACAELAAGLSQDIERLVTACTH